MSHKGGMDDLDAVLNALQADADYERFLEEEKKLSLDDLKAELRAEHIDPELYLTKILREFEVSRDEIRLRLATNNTAFHKLIRAVTESWQGLLSSLPSLPIAAELALDTEVSSSMKYFRFESPLEHFFDQTILNNELKWARGYVRVVGDMQNGRIRSLKVSTRLAEPRVPGACLTIRLSDQDGNTVAFVLGPDEPSVTVSGVELSGAAERLHLIVSLN